MLKFNKTKRNIILFIVLILSVITLTVSFAFLAVRLSDASESNLNIGTVNYNRLLFSNTDGLNIELTEENLSQGASSLSDSMSATANLIMGTENETATDSYNAYLYISDNNYEYTTIENTPEMLMKVYDPSNTEITDITGLSYDTVVDASGDTLTGFDITTLNGLITLRENQSITTTDSENGTSQEWRIEVSFVNLTTNQVNNSGKELVSLIVLQKGEFTYPFYDYLKDNHNESNGLYYHNSGNTLSAEDNSYRYSGPDSLVNNYVCFGSDEVVCPAESLYRIIGIFDQNVKLVKATPVDKNNDGAITPNDNTDKFMFDESNYALWRGKDSNINSDDASINIYLNNDYYDNLLTKYANMIESTKLQINSFNLNKILEYPKDVFNEDNKSLLDIDTEYNIGLMQISDVVYGVSPDHWDLPVFDLNEPHNDSFYQNAEVINDNWLFYRGVENYMEMLITRVYGNTTNVVYSTGVIGAVLDNSASYYGYVRPTLYLKDTVRYSSGTGSQSDPFRISL